MALTTKQIDEFTIAFQTYCLYDSCGQIIIARQVGNGVLFIDVCRGIYGFMESCDFNQSAIHQAYLHDRYDWPPRELTEARYELENMSTVIREELGIIPLAQRAYCHEGQLTRSEREWSDLCDDLIGTDVDKMVAAERALAVVTGHNLMTSVKACLKTRRSR